MCVAVGLWKGTVGTLVPIITPETKPSAADTASITDTMYLGEACFLRVRVIIEPGLGRSMILSYFLAFWAALSQKWSLSILPAPINFNYLFSEHKPKQNLRPVFCPIHPRHGEALSCVTFLMGHRLHHVKLICQIPYTHQCMGHTRVHRTNNHGTAEHALPEDR